MTADAGTLMRTVSQCVEKPKRQWLGSIDIAFERRPIQTVITHTQHCGPLRIQRPFYPESNGCCHVYLLHPPGGLVIGDRLDITLNINKGAHALLTTPSAGKIYGAKKSEHTQGQFLSAAVEENGVLEWLPQETIVFNGANGVLGSKIQLHKNAKFFGWDIARLGRVASEDYFISGSCQQRFEVWRDGLPLHIEKIDISPQCKSFQGRYGLDDANTTATLIATMVQSRDDIDGLLSALSEKNLDTHGVWGLTQKNSLFIARYLGNSVTDCRKGFEYIWQKTRGTFNGFGAVPPRIWNT